MHARDYDYSCVRKNARVNILINCYWVNLIVSNVSTLVYCLFGAIIGLLFGLSYSPRIVGEDPDLVNILTLICVLIGIRLGNTLSKIGESVKALIWNNKSEKSSVREA